MKRVLLLGLLTCIMSFAKAQTVPNAGFENWDSNAMYENPTGYSTSNTYVYPQIGESNVTKQTPAPSGSYSVRLVTMDVQGYPFLGFMMYGDPSGLISGGGLTSVKGGFPYSQKPEVFEFYARHQCSHHDSAVVIVILKMTLAGQSVPYSFTTFKLYDTVNTYKKYSFDIIDTLYPLPQLHIPDTAIIVFTSSDPLIQDSTTIGNWLEVDKMSFKKKSGATMSPIPNNDFEQWDDVAGVEPQGWVTLNFIDQFMGQPQGVIPVTPGHSGNFAAKITSNTLDMGGPGSDTFRILVLGDINANNPGMGIIDNPDSLSFWYKYNNAKNTKDSGYVVVLFSKFNSTTSQTERLDSNAFALGAASSFTYKTLKFPNIYGKSPDSMAIVFSSSKLTPTGRGIGNYLIVDDLVLWSHHVGIAVASKDQANTFVYPNPANNFVNVQFELNTPSDITISLVDLTGRKVKSQDFSLSKGKQLVKLDLQEVSDGNYLVVIGQGTNLVYSKRIAVSR